MSKAHDPHWRYVALRFEAGPPLSRKAAGSRLGRIALDGKWPNEDRPQLTRFAFPHAIAKVHHHRLADLRAALDAAADITTLSSSGTIKTLTDRLGILAERGEKKPQSAPTRPAKGAKPTRPAPSPAPRSPPTSGPAPAPGRRRRPS